MLTHTPGPWEFERKFICNGDQDIKWYAIRRAGDVNGSLANVVDGNYEPMEANARLIAAAPEMLAALKAFVEQAEKLRGFPAQYDPYVGPIVAARDAIARVEGSY